MKQQFRILITFVTVLTIILSLFSFNVSAASAIISFNKSTVDVGDKVTVTVTVKGNNLTGADINITYTQDVISYVSGADSGGAGVLKIVDMTLSEETSKSYTVTFKAEKAGACQISTSGLVSDGIPATDVEVGASATLNVVNKTLSSNANLKSLRLGVGQLSPAFSPNITSYDVLIPYSATKCLVYATTADSGATFDVEGSSEMKIGANKRVVIVTAPDGSQKSYTLNITRSETPDEDTTSETESTTSTSSLMTSLGTSEYIVASDISSVNIFKGFKLSTAKYNGVDVSITTDENGIYKIYYLKSPNSEELVPCLLDNETNTFEKLKYVTLGENTYIFADFPEDKTVPSDYYTISGKVFDYTLDCYSSSDTKYTDFYYVYCYVNDKFGVYRYDSKENTLQRYPELVLLDDASNNENVKDNIFSKFDSLKTNAKIMVISLLVAILLALALIVLIIIKLFNKNNYDDLEDFEEEDFEEVSFDDNFLLESDEEDDEDN